jgi:hypothetical protein
MRFGTVNAIDGLGVSQAAVDAGPEANAFAILNRARLNAAGDLQNRVFLSRAI